MRLYVRKRTGWVTFIHNTDELKEFVAGFLDASLFLEICVHLMNNAQHTFEVYRESFSVSLLDLDHFGFKIY